MWEGCEGSRGERDAMDTPERSKNTQIAASIGKFEDSPVFNFLNSLSPIKPVKPMHISQSINPLSFSSLPSVFSSPQLASLRESKFLCRHQLLDPSKPEFSSDDGSAVNDANNSNSHATPNVDEQKENLDPRESNCENTGDPCSKDVVEFAESLNCESGIVSSSLSSLIAKNVAEYACTSSSCGPYVEEQRSVNIGEANLEGLGNINQHNWDNLIADASDLLIFESPNTEPYNESVDPATTFYQSIRNAIQNAQSLGAVVCGERGREGSDASNEPRPPAEGTEMIENASDASFLNSNIQKMDYENLSGLCRGMRRRCLVFELAGARRKHMEQGSPSDSSLLLTSDVNASSSKQIVRTNAEKDPSSLLPGIGLHLNALAMTPKDFKIVNHDSSASGRLLIGSSSSLNFPSPNSNHNLLSNSLAEYSLEREIDAFESGGLFIEDRSQESGLYANEDINPNSPKKRRRRSEQGGDGESCKRCNCKKSKCLKLYCECFAAGVYCVEPCACVDCFNKPIHEDTVLATRKQIESRNPLAFAPKVIRSSDPLISDIGDDFANTPASARHKRGCNCKKSGCLKKYCECYQGGVGCSINCRCEGCKNAFGRKDGSGASSMEPDYEEEENEATEKVALDRSLYKAAIHDDHEQNMDSAPSATPLGRQPFQTLSKKRPPRASFPPISSYSGLAASQGFGKSSLFSSLPKFSPCFETVEGDEMPHFLQGGGGGGSPIGSIKTSSPNRKRVSPPQTSSNTRSSRKLILQSIPSFPSLAQNQ